MIAKLIQRLYNGLLRPFCDPQPFLDADSTSWVREVESQWIPIRDEMRRVLSEKFVPAFDDITGQYGLGGDKWRSYMLIFYGRSIRENCRNCPHTVAVLKRIPNMTLAMFSVMPPGIHVPAHEGPFRGVLRYHLGLEVPKEEGCRIRVGNDVRRWEEGRSLLFDDTFNHEVWNDTHERRVILFVDVLRPLPWPMSWVNSGMVTAIGLVHPGVRFIVRNSRRFARRPLDAPKTGAVSDRDDNQGQKQSD